MSTYHSKPLLCLLFTYCKSEKPQEQIGADAWVYTCHSWPSTLDATLTPISKSNTLQGLCLQNYQHFSYPWPDPKPSGSGRISSETSLDPGLAPTQIGNNRKAGSEENQHMHFQPRKFQKNRKSNLKTMYVHNAHSTVRFPGSQPLIDSQQQPLKKQVIQSLGNGVPE